ncbi:MAG: preprotein translocase subunit SecA [Candidatus Egerieousia sp.]|nr:preprotein translocase subunit SecA [bacterium]MDY5255944.1 preprotein translocase subunit SecA [Candidatus Egerieousia sp.]
MGTFLQLLKKILGSKEERDMKQIKPILDKILAVYPQIDALSHDQLREASQKIKQRIADYVQKERDEKRELRAKLEDMNISPEEKEEIASKVDKLAKKIDTMLEEVLMEVLPEAFAIMKSTARRFKENSRIVVKAMDWDRALASTQDVVTIEGENAVWKNQWMAGGNLITWDMVHYDVQLIGGIVLHKGMISEMATGEGKTLVATLPVFLNALAGEGVHVVTVNDYLSKRDSEWMGPLYQFHGLTVDCIDKHEPNSVERRQAYRCDITYGTNNEFGFDYLRDNMVIEPRDLVQRKHHYAIVDEVDSVLIDDARTPLIISGPVQKGEDQHFAEFKPIVERLYNTQRNEVTKILNEAKRLIAAGNTEEGGKLLLRAHKGLPRYNPLIKFLSEPGMKQILISTENFYMQDNNKQMYKVTDELYFVIDEKNKSVELTDKGHDLLANSLDDSRFFVLPDVGVEVAEIEKSNLSAEEKMKKKDELLADYALKAERVHTVNQLLKAYTMFEKDVEYVIMDNKVKIVDEQTGRILEGRRYSEGLHQAIEAKENVKVEAATQTFATITLQNYFRMYHKLAGMTGTAQTEAGEFWSIYKLEVVTIPTNKPVIRKDEDDQIYKTKKDKYNAVIEKIVQLKEQGRPVLVGTTSVEVSELLSRMLKLRGIKHNVLNAKQHAREAEIVAEAGRKGCVTIATNMAGRGTDIKLTDEVKSAGGLAIIGTARHDSRRVDRQLRGRSGRQGDPGSSLFYVSLEDDLLRLFGAERISKIVDAMGLKEGEALQHKMLSKSIERAQRKVEEINFGVRKRLLEYDDVMNSQRSAIYGKRKNALFGERIDIDVKNMISDFAIMFVEANDIPYADFKLELLKQLSIEPDFDEAFYSKASKEEIAERLENCIKAVINRRNEEMIRTSWPVIEQVYKTQSATYTNIAIPVGDGHKGLNIVINLQKAYESMGKELPRAVAKTITLITIDNNWKEHLREMDDLKQSVQNASYEQKDPLLIYKLESYNLFQSVIEKINREVLSFLVRAQLPVAQNESLSLREETKRRRTDMSNMRTSRSELSTNSGEPKSNAPVHVEKKVGRNDPCPCGSGKKYKNCCGKE